MTGDRRTVRAPAAAGVVGVLATAGCSAGLDSLPLPAPSVGAHT